MRQALVGIIVLCGLSVAPSTAHAAFKIDLNSPGSAFFGPPTGSVVPANPVVFVNTIGPRSVQFRAVHASGKQVALEAAIAGSDTGTTLWRLELETTRAGAVEVIAEWTHRGVAKTERATYRIDKRWRPSRLVARDRSQISIGVGLSHHSVSITFDSAPRPSLVRFRMLEGTRCASEDYSVHTGASFYGATPTGELEVTPVWPDGSEGSKWVGRAIDVPLSSTWRGDDFRADRVPASQRCGRVHTASAAKGAAEVPRAPGQVGNVYRPSM